VSHDIVYTPQLQADANINEGEFVEVVPFFGTLRYDDDPGSTPRDRRPNRVGRPQH
jgi:hypothetical protein